ncbi:hypothetical protein [Streptomyces sp. MMG1121]|uniref:hypothetical protein n=1 Tax=Streptomyces sp. MMG1121 TaxID=1415544 RepID=UPI0006AEAF79|nr:hypothetical protein [Streptomyces sp. MMG1121]KOV63087.1 hypothetical protein ADK64_22370 [Streptomyces sp. MMG1121]
MEAVIAVFALLFLLLIGLGAYATVKAVGAAKRGVDRTIEQARRTVEDHTLRAKSFVQIGPAAEIAQLRLALRTSMRATQDALRTGAAEDESLKESLGLFERLSAHGHQLDADLRRLEAEPDRAEVSARLAELRERTERITKSADSLRRAVRDRERRFTDDDLGALSDQIDIEADALRHWTPAGPAGTPPQWTDAPAASSTAEEPPPQAITPPSARPVHPWQKKPRPESTA